MQTLQHGHLPKPSYRAYIMHEKNKSEQEPGVKGSVPFCFVRLSGHSLCLSCFSHQVGFAF